MQIHAHRDGIAHVMNKAGGSTKRARRRAESGEIPRMSGLHFPLGGPQFRPFLEDVFKMLVCELDVGCDSAGRRVLADGREEWRRLHVPTSQVTLLRMLLRCSGSSATGCAHRGLPAPPAANLDRLREH